MADKNDNQVVTDAKVTDIDINEILGMPDGDSIVDTTSNNNIFKRDKTDVSFVNNTGAASKKKDDEGSTRDDNGAGTDDGKKKDDVADITSIGTKDDEDKKGKGRPPLDKSGLVEATKSLIEKKLLIPFDDEKPIEEYTTADFIELIDANLKEKERSVSEEVPKAFFESLPQEFQYAAKYLQDGGTDIKGLLKVLSDVEEVKDLDPTKENHQETIVRNYLRAANFGTEEDIDDEINGWKDRGELGTKANKFKPKLDKMKEEQVAYRLAQQENYRKQQEQAAKGYMDTVYKALEPGELNGVKLDRKTQNLLYSGLVQANYPSITGRNVNMLGHYLEKYQFVEPKPDLIAEVLWLLHDPAGYKSKIREAGEKAATESTVKKLKTEQASKGTGGADEEEDQGRSSKKGLQRASKNFFQR